MNINHHNPDATVAILAGNSRVSVEDHGGAIVVQPQLNALTAALNRARDLAALGVNPCVSVAFDHRGIFRKQFLRPGLPNSAKRNPRLAQLLPDIVAQFSPVCENYGIDVSSVWVIHEDSARTHASHAVNSGQCPSHLTRWMVVNHEEEEETILEGCEAGVCSRGGSSQVDRVTCAAVTSEYYLKAISLAGTPQALEVFFEDDPWSTVAVYTRGAALLEARGSMVPVSLNWSTKSGSLFSSKRKALAALGRS